MASEPEAPWVASPTRTFWEHPSGASVWTTRQVRLGQSDVIWKWCQAANPKRFCRGSVPTAAEACARALVPFHEGQDLANALHQAIDVALNAALQASVSDPASQAVARCDEAQTTLNALIADVAERLPKS